MIAQAANTRCSNACGPVASIRLLIRWTDSNSIGGALDRIQVNRLPPSKAFHSMICNRLEVICHEDLDTLAAPHVFPFVAASLAASRERYSKSIGEARLMVGNAIRMMARAPKSRAGCHFAAAIGLRSMLEDFAPEIPDWANDQHTIGGRKLGRGLDHFRQEGAKLIPPPTEPDPYEDEAYRLWTIKQQGK